VVLNQFGLIRNLTDVKVLSEWGILFLVRYVTAAALVIAFPPMCLSPSNEALKLEYLNTV